MPIRNLKTRPCLPALVLFALLPLAPLDALADRQQ